MKLHIEGKDAPKLMHMIDGMSTLRITDDEFRITRCTPKVKIWDRVRFEEHETWYGTQIRKIEWKEFDYIWPQKESLYCAMKAAMRGMGWSGRDSGNNSISVPNFLAILRRHADENTWDIRYIEISEE